MMNVEGLKKSLIKRRTVNFPVVMKSKQTSLLFHKNVQRKINLQ